MNKVVKSVLVISTGIVTGCVIGNVINTVSKREKMYHSIVTGLVESLESTHEYFADKATDEYKKYKEKTLSEVETDYLNSIKGLEQMTVKK